jgi:hypothetical protein
MYFPLRGSHFLIQKKQEKINFSVHINWATLEWFYLDHLVVGLETSGRDFSDA